MGGATPNFQGSQGAPGTTNFGGYEQGAFSYTAAPAGKA